MSSKILFNVEEPGVKVMFKAADSWMIGGVYKFFNIRIVTSSTIKKMDPKAKGFSLIFFIFAIFIMWQKDNMPKTQIPIAIARHVVNKFKKFIL